jgi:hypothetical protein
MQLLRHVHTCRPVCTPVQGFDGGIPGRGGFNNSVSTSVAFWNLQGVHVHLAACLHMPGYGYGFFCSNGNFGGEVNRRLVG